MKDRTRPRVLSSTHFPLLQLPDALIRKCLASLEVMDRLNCRMACKRLAALPLDRLALTGGWWHRALALAGFVSFVSRGALCSELQVYSSSVPTNGLVTAAAVLGRCSALESVAVAVEPDGARELLWLLAGRPSVHSVDITVGRPSSAYGYSVSPDLKLDLSLLADRLHSLSSLALRCGVDTMLHQATFEPAVDLPRLTRLEITGSMMTAVSWARLVALRDLTLGGMDVTGYHPPLAVDAFASTLRALRWKGTCTALDPGRTLPLLAGRLECLSLALCDDRRARDLTHVLDLLLGSNAVLVIHTLELAGLEDLPSGRLLAMLKRLPCLRILRLPGLPAKASSGRNLEATVALARALPCCAIQAPERDPLAYTARRSAPPPPQVVYAGDDDEEWYESSEPEFEEYV